MKSNKVQIKSGKFLVYKQKVHGSRVPVFPQFSDDRVRFDGDGQFAHDGAMLVDKFAIGLSPNIVWASPEYIQEHSVQVDKDTSLYGDDDNYGIYDFIQMIVKLQYDHNWFDMTFDIAYDGTVGYEVIHEYMGEQTNYMMWKYSQPHFSKVMVINWINTWLNNFHVIQA